MQKLVEDFFDFPIKGALKCQCFESMKLILKNGKNNEYYVYFEGKIIRDKIHEEICTVRFNELVGKYIHKIGNFKNQKIYSFDEVTGEILESYERGVFKNKIQLYRLLTERTKEKDVLGCKHLESISLLPFIEDVDFSIDDIMYMLECKIDKDDISLCKEASMFCVHRLCTRYTKKNSLDPNSYIDHYKDYGSCIRKVAAEYIKSDEYNIDPVVLLNYYKEELEEIDARRSKMSEIEKSNVSRMEMLDIYSEMNEYNDIIDIIHFLICLTFKGQINIADYTFISMIYYTCAEIDGDKHICNTGDILDIDEELGQYIFKCYLIRLSELLWHSSKEVLKSTEVAKTIKNARK